MAEKEEKIYVSSGICDNIGKALKSYGITAEWLEDRFTGIGYCYIAFKNISNIGVSFQHSALKHLGTYDSHLGDTFLHNSVIDGLYLKDIHGKEFDTRY